MENKLLEKCPYQDQAFTNSIGNNGMLQAKKTSTAWQRAFKAKTTWRAPIKCVAPINAWGMRETRLEELLGRNTARQSSLLLQTQPFYYRQLSTYKHQ